MDPATAAGIGMAVTSLAAQCLAGAMHAINLISSARNLEPDYQYLVVRLRLEQQRLCNWSVEVGLLGFLNGDDSAPRSQLLGLKREIIVDTLYHIQTLAAGFIESNEKFGGLVPDVTNPSGGGAKMLDDDGLHGFPYSMNSWEKHNFSSPGIKSLPKRLKWATFYKERYETLVVRLRDMNDVLIDLVDSEARVAIRQTTRETDTTILHLHNRVDDLVQLFKALFADKTTDGTIGISSTWRDGIDVQQRHDLAKLAYFKAVNTSIEDNTYLASCGPLIGADRVPGRRLQRSDVHLLHDLGDTNACRCEAELSQDSKTRERVWVEWRNYDPITQAQPALHTSRVGKLVSLLSDPYKPDLLRVPDCIGYFDDPRCKQNNYRKGRLGFVFRWPSSTSTGPVCLRTLIISQTKPMLTERIALAKAIGDCLMSLHSVNWLHKGIRSQSILFFPEEHGNVDYSRPYVSGFGYSRPSFREDMTEVPSQDPAADMYRHPRTHGLGPWEGRQGFKRTFDIYSLGLVLVEIATWQTLETVLGLRDPGSLDASELKGIQRRVLDEKGHLQSVGANAGAKFCHATRVCLDSTEALGISHLDDEGDAHVSAKVSRGFYHQVLLPLEEIHT